MSDILSGFWNYIQEMWMADVIGKILAVFLIAFVAALTALALYVAVSIILFIDRKIEWYSDRKHCTHCQGWTLHVSDGQFAECPTGQACCEACTHRHEMNNEVKLFCPVGGEELTKTSVNGQVIIDTCPNGHGIWLSQDELDAIEEDAYNQGRSVGQATGLAIGIAT